MKLLISTLLTLVFAYSTEGSHFRGGTISWSVTSSSNGVYQIRLPFRISWRRDSIQPECDASLVASGTVTGTAYQLTCTSGGCSGATISNLGFHCTDFSITEDWSTGTNVINYNYNANSYGMTFTAGFTGCCWIGGMNFGSGSSWSMITRINLASRTDTGNINVSPVTAMAPIERLQSGCCHNITIPVVDDDGDVVRCRWASGNECDGICNGFLGATLDEENCVLHYCATGNLGWYPVAVQIEDFARSDTTHSNPLSSVPLQFLVYVYRASGSCESGQNQTAPSFVSPPTPSNNAQYSVGVGGTITFNITARAYDGATITTISTVSPTGMVKGPLVQDSSSTWSMVIKYTPTADSVGQNIFCYTAADSNDQQTSQWCIKISVSTTTTPKPTTTPAITTTTAPPCYADIVYVIDTSDSICESVQIGHDCIYWDAMNQFLDNFTSSFPVGQTQTKMAYVHFSSVDHTAVQFNLNAYNTTSDVLNAINQVNYWSLSGDTDTGGALALVRDQVLQPSAGDRTTAPNIVIIFTDGDWNVGTDPVAVANDLWARGDTYIFAVGIGNMVSSTNLLKLVHSQSNIFTVNGYLALGDVLKNELLSATGCHEDTNHCMSHPCLNNGTCTSTDTSFVCTCAEGYTGYNCADVVPCQINICQHGGTCIPHSTYSVCACTADWIGQYCEYPNPCANGGCTHLTDSPGVTTQPVVSGHCVAAGTTLDCTKVPDGNYNDPAQPCASHYISCNAGVRTQMPCAAETYFDCINDYCNIKQLVAACQG